jgi:hypothetical protein
MVRLPAACARLLVGIALGWLTGNAADVGAEGFSLAWWRDGPPYVKRAPEWQPGQAVLCLQSDRIGFVLDTVSLRALHAGTFDHAPEKSAVLAGDDPSLAQLPSPLLDFQITVDGTTWRCVGRDPRPTDDLRFPVRVIESGRALQHVVIDGLRFEDEHQRRWAGAGSLEVALWPDRLVLTAAVKGTGEGSLTLRVGERHVTAALGRPAHLTLFAPAATLPAPTIAGDGGTAVWDEVRGAWRLDLRVGPWPRPTPGGYSLADPDRLDRWRFTLRNPTSGPLAIPLLFVPEPVRGITGVSAILCEEDGVPTGLPVQLSKNWHVHADRAALPEQGSWLHAAAHLILPPRSERTLQLVLTYARWGGLPAASHAQLSLVGWGHNQFWDEVAVGSFGESICFEPGRVQRRCFITDLRPLMTLGKSREPGGWANNGGGGDFLVWIDPAGRWRGWSGTRTDYRSPGPCLTDVVYHEQTAGGEIRSQVRVRVPRGDDHLRVLFQIRHEVRAPVRWQRLAFFQLGADFYNFTPARRVAVGDATGLREEWTPRGPKLTHDREHVPLTGAMPWISIHDIDHAALRPGNAAASRGLIIRSWEGRLNGRSVGTPHLSTLRTEISGGTLTTALELVPPPDVTELRPGDFIAAELELVIFPALAADYWGGNRAFEAALAREADTWRLVHAEAAGNALTVRASRGAVESAYPLRVRVAEDGRAALTVDGGLGAVPITFAGVGQPRGFTLRIDGRPINQSVHGNDYWQADRDPAEGTWALTFNVPLGPGPHTVDWTGARPPRAAPKAAPRRSSPMLTR